MPWLLLASVPLAVVVGYAAQRGSICAVKGAEELLDGHRPRMLWAFLCCSLWVALATLPLLWGAALPGHLAPDLPVSTAALLGGFVVGVGAAINGGCSFATVIRLAAGELSFALTLVGLSLGALAHRAWPLPAALAPSGLTPIGPSPLAQPQPWSLALLAVLALWGLFEALRLGRLARLRFPGSGRWPPEAATAVIGIAGGILYAFHGSWMYTVALDRGLGGMMGAGLSDGALGLLLAALLGGAALGARRMRLHRLRLYRLRWGGRAGATRLLGGALMGYGATMVPGGNDVLVMHALPALSAHALPAYLALLLGAGVSLQAGRWWRSSAMARA